MPREEIDRRVASVAEKLGLAPFVARKPHALSGGQRQRVALGRAIVRDPKVFLFDEPLSNLDASLRVTTRNELVKQQHELGTTTIYVTHDQVEAMTMGDRICIMNKGEVVQIGKPLEVYRNPADTFVARFLGNPPMNLLAGRLERRESRPLLSMAGCSFEIPGYSPAALAPYVDGPVTVGMRPEDLYEAPPEPGSDRMQAMTARILAVEPLGAETLLMLAVGNCRRGDHRPHRPRHGADAGEEARLFLDHDGHPSLRSGDDKGHRPEPRGKAMKDAGIVDCHLHIIDHGRFPFRPGLAIRRGRTKPARARLWPPCSTAMAWLMRCWFSRAATASTIPPCSMRWRPRPGATRRSP